VQRTEIRRSDDTARPHISDWGNIKHFYWCLRDKLAPLLRWCMRVLKTFQDTGSLG